MRGESVEVNCVNIVELLVERKQVEDFWMSGMNLRSCKHSQLNSWNGSPQRAKIWPVCVCVYDEYVQIKSWKCIWSRHLLQVAQTGFFTQTPNDWKWRLMAVCRLSNGSHLNKFLLVLTLQSAMWSSVRQSGEKKLLNCTLMHIFNVSAMFLWCSFNHLMIRGCRALGNLSSDLFWYLSELSPECIVTPLGKDVNIFSVAWNVVSKTRLHIER